MQTSRSQDGAARGRETSLDQPFQVGGWSVDPSANRVCRDDEEVRLEPKVMRVLVVLAERAGQVVTRHELEQQAWAGMIVTDDAVTNSLIKLRKALGDDARNPSYIETIAKSGYRLIAPVTPPATEAAGLEPAAPGSVEDPADHSPPVAAAVAGRAKARLALLVLIPLGLTVLVLGWFWVRPHGVAPPPAPQAAADRPVIAVLPFENLTADPEQDYFADGITEDLITDLSKLSGLQVVARDTAFVYRDGREPEVDVGRELGAHFIVTGSVQRADDRLRINVRLTDAVAGRNRWGERYDRQLADIFRVQDEITARVVSALQVELAPGEQQRLTRRYATNVQAYDEYLRGLDLLGRRASADNPDARAHFERAIALEPEFARAHAGLAMTYALQVIYRSGPMVASSLARAEEIARRGLAIDDSLPQLRYALGLVEMYRGNLAAAVAEVSRAIELRPSYADGYGLLAWILHFAGRPEEGLEAMQQAIALNPRANALYRTVQAALHYQLGDVDTALQLLETSVEVSPNQLLTRLFLAAVYAAAGELEAARWQVEELRALEPEFKLNLEQGMPIRDPRYRERFLADLRRAGLFDD